MPHTHFEPDVFFDLSDFAWKELFTDGSAVWDVLPHLTDFINKINHGRKVVLGEESTIEPTAKISGTVCIGKNSRIGHGALLRDNVVIGDHCTIGHAVELKNCIILNNTAIAHLNYIGDSIIGNFVNISGGAMLANLRFDKKPVTVAYDGKKIPTNLAKFGAVIGDYTQIGVNSVLNPGTVLGKNTIVYPLQMVSGYHGAGEVIKA